MENDYNNEWNILVSIAKGDNDAVKNILKSSEVNFGELIEQAMLHKMFPMVCYEFINDDDLYSCIPPFVNQYFRICYDVNLEKTRKIKSEALNVGKELQKNGILYAATKGVLLDKLLYGDVGMRFLSDADFMIDFKDKQSTSEILRKLGFVEGTVDWRRNKVRGLNRDEHLRYLLASEKMPEYIKQLDDSIVNYVSIGFVCSFTWAKCEYTVDLDKAFNYISKYEIDDEGNFLNGLSISYHFIYIILHLYKHAWVEFLGKWKNDVNLVKFADVYLYWKKYEDILVKELPQIIEEFQIEKPILWTLYHTDQIFNSEMVSKLNYKDFANENRDYLNSAADKQGNTRLWKGSMMDRLFSKNREKLFELD